MELIVSIVVAIKCIVGAIKCELTSVHSLVGTEISKLNCNQSEAAIRLQYFCPRSMATVRGTYTQLWSFKGPVLFVLPLLLMADYC